jgi:histidinol-phosphate aminotransferase
LGEGFKFNADTFMKKSDKANLLFLCTPNNPTGRVIKLEDIIKVAATGKTTVVDEAYYEFGGETAVGLIRDYDNIIVLRTMAKAFGLAGLRIGYAIAGEDATRALEAVKPPFNVNYLAHEAAMLALSDLDYMRETVGKIKEDRDGLYTKLSAKYNAIPSESNFVLVDVSPMTADEFFDRMLEEKIVVRKMGRFEGFEGQWIRINLGREEENKKLFEAVDKISR